MNLHVERRGKGRIVIQLHGFLESSSMWDYLEWDNCLQVRVDLPGHGSSPHFDCDNISAMAKLVAESLSSNELADPVVVGHSMGGYVALELLKYLERPRLVLLNSNFWSDSEQKRSDRVRVAQVVKDHKNAFITEAIPNLFAHPEQYSGEVLKLISEAKKMKWEAIASASLAMGDRKDNSELVKLNRDAILVIQGKDDSIVTRADMSERALQIALDFVEVDSGHMSHIENPEVVQQLIKEYIN